LSWVELDTFMVKRGGSVNPAKFPDEIFELLSIPAFDKGEPEIIAGKDIGSSKKCVEPNDILLSKIVPHIRRCLVVPEKSKLRQIASGEWIQFRSEKIIPDYLKFILISDPFHQQFMNTISGVGGSLLRASPARVAKIKIPHPPLADQQKIAEILDAADALRQKDQQLIDHYTALSQSLFLAMFGKYIKDKKCYKEISDVADFIDYRGKTPQRTESGIPLISAKSVRVGYFDKSRLDFITSDVYQKVMTRGYPKIGDVLFTTEGATMGFTCRIPTGLDKFAVGQRLITLQSTDLYNNISLEFMLNSREIQGEIFRLATGSAVKGIRSAKFAKILIPVPPINLQNKFAERITSIEKQKQQAQTNLEQSNNLLNSLLQKAFTGELTQSKVQVA